MTTTTTTKKYSFKDHPDHEAMLPEWGQKSIANVLNCSALTDDEKQGTREAVVGLYAAADLPAPMHTLFVRSPLVGAIAGAVAAGAWWVRENPQHHEDTFGDHVTEADLMYCVMHAAINGIRKGIATLRKDDVQNVIAEKDCMTAALTAASVNPNWTVDIEKESEVHKNLLEFFSLCLPNWWKLHNGGQFWGGWVYYLNFGLRVAKRTDIDYSKFIHYETLGHVGPRFMDHKFCIISDRPTVIHRDERNNFRPHCTTGPHIAWRDGVEIYTIAGIRVTPAIVAGRFTAADALDESNAELRRIMIEIYERTKQSRWVIDVGAQVIHSDVDAAGRTRKLYRKEIPGDEPYCLIEIVNWSTEDDGHRKVYHMRVPPDATPMADRGAFHASPKPQEMTCQNALAATYGFYGHEYQPGLET